MRFFVILLLVAAACARPMKRQEEQPSKFATLLNKIGPMMQEIYGSFYEQGEQVYKQLLPEIKKFESFAVTIQPELENLYLSMEPQIMGTLEVLKPEAETLLYFFENMDYEDLEALDNLANDYVVPFIEDEFSGEEMEGSGMPEPAARQFESLPFDFSSLPFDFMSMIPDGIFDLFEKKRQDEEMTEMMPETKEDQIIAYFQGLADLAMEHQEVLEEMFLQAQPLLEKIESFVMSMQPEGEKLLKSMKPQLEALGQALHPVLGQIADFYADMTPEDFAEIKEFVMTQVMEHMNSTEAPEMVAARHFESFFPFPPEFESFFEDFFESFEMPEMPEEEERHLGSFPFPPEFESFFEDFFESFEMPEEEERQEEELPYYHFDEVAEDVQAKVMALYNQYESQMEQMMKQIKPTVEKVEKFVETMKPELEALFISMQPDIMAMGQELQQDLMPFIEQAVEYAQSLDEEDFEEMKGFVMEQAEMFMEEFMYEEGSFEPMMESMLPIEFESMMIEEMEELDTILIEDFGSMMPEEFGSFEEPAFFEEIIDEIVPEFQSLYEKFQPKVKKMFEKLQPHIEKVKEFAMTLQPELENLYMSFEPQLEAMFEAVEPELEEMGEFAEDMSLEDVDDMVEFAEEYMPEESMMPEQMSA